MAEEIRISRAFIEQELPQAPPLYVSVFLMTQAIGQKAAEVAHALDILESDVLRAWKYWQERGYLLEAQQQEMAAKPVASARPEYTPAELSAYLKHPDIQLLFRSAEQKLGKSLSYSDMAMLFSFYDWLGLPMDVIELLLSDCVSRGKRGMRYIEKVAIAWAEEGIDTPEKAAEYLRMRRQGYREVMRAFGQGNRMPAPEEEKYLKKWLRTYHLPTEIVAAACERTILRTGGVSFAYADRILEQWHKAKVQSMADVQKLDEAFAAKKAVHQKSEPTYRQQSKPHSNRFINYTQREWDYAELERLEREKQSEW